MKIAKLAAGAGLALTLAAFSPAAFAQNSISSNGSRTEGIAYNNNGTNNYKGSNSDNGKNNHETLNGENPRQEAVKIRERIDMESRNGQNVSSAEHQYELGKRALNNGKSNKARHHFKRAEKELGMTEQNTGTVSATVPSSGGSAARTGDSNR